MIRWYAVHTRPRAEAKALMHLRRQGFEAYLPRIRRKRSHARRVDTVLAALFPRYLFAALDLEAHRWRAVHSTVGVHQLIMQGPWPIAVPDDVITALRAHEGADGVISFKNRLQKGDKITVTEGPLAEYTGILENMPDGDRVTVLLSILGRETRTSVLRSQVQPAAA